MNQKTAKGSELIFLCRIKRNGTGTDSVECDMSYLDDTTFLITSLSITNQTFIACEFNCYVVRFKHK